MARALVLIVATLVVAAVQASELRGSSAISANPIRKVVTLLQNMQKKIQAEGEKEQALYDKFMCYCKNSGGGLAQSIAASENKVPALSSSIKEAEAKKAQLEAALKSHQTDRSAAKAAIASATAIRDKEAAAFAKQKSELSANIGALSKAVAAVSSGSFLQTQTSQLLKHIVISKENLLEADRQDIMAFLSNGQGDQSYVPGTGQIIGILSTMKEEMSKSASDAEAEESAAIAAFEEMVAAKEKEIDASTKAIEEKTLRIGETGVDIAEMKNDLTDTEEQLIEDQKFLADLDKTCKTQTKEWGERVKTRGEETQAVAETIKILNDDDALELFKKTLPSAASFVQMAEGRSAMREKALEVIRQARRQALHPQPSFDFITLAIEGKNAGFEKVIKMIDEMTATLKQEQLDDEHKREYCTKQFEFAEDKKKGLVKTVSDSETSIEDAKEGISTLTSDIATLEDGIKALDKSVSEATQQRKEEHEDYVALLASDSAAKNLLKFAMNRLQKFYNPKLYKPPPKRELSEEDAITVNMGGTLAPTAAPGGIAGTGITAFAQVNRRGAPPPPPQALSGYKKKTEESGGVIAMIKLLIQDLDKELAEAEVTEKDSQADYEVMLKASSEKRATDAKSLTEKNAAKANLETDLQSYTESKEAAAKELMGTDKYISSLHGECDWLLQYFDARKAARTSEMESLQTAKAVLSGADYSLIEQSHQRTSFNLRRHRGA